MKHPKITPEFVVLDEPVAYLHILHMELGQRWREVTFSPKPPFGVPGENYSEEYTVTTIPLYRRTVK